MNRSHVLVTLLEEIAGSAAIVYHRTGSKSFIDPSGKELSGKAIPENIIKEGFAQGEDGWYGPGIYTTYRLESQFRDVMNIYGDYLVKCRVNLQGYIILDYAEARKVYKDKYTLVEQLRQYYSTAWLNRERAWIEIAHQQMRMRPQEKTSTIALDLAKYHHVDTVVAGMVFVGGHDDAVVVTYKSGTILPIEYAYHPVGTQGSVAWMPFDASVYRGHLRKVGSLIHVPLAQGSPGFLEFFQELRQLTHFTQREIITKLGKITSLSIIYTDISPTLNLEQFPSSFLRLVRQKFARPETELFPVIQRFLDQRYEGLVFAFCRSLRESFPALSVQCHSVADGVHFTLTFPTSKALFLFLEYCISQHIFTVYPLVDFLRADTPKTRAAILKAVLTQIWTQVYKDFLPIRHLEYLTALVNNAPATK